MTGGLRPSPVWRPRAVTLALALVVALVAGCQQQERTPAQFTPLALEQSGPPRAYRLGFSALPAELSDDAYLAAFDLAANYGEVLLIQRPPSWADFLPGALLSSGLRDATLSERAAIEERDLLLLFALDVFDPTDRGRLAALPAGYEGRDLTDRALRLAFVAEAKYVALNYRPTYLVLGSEVNAAFERSPAAYRAFVEAYEEAYDAVKQASPSTLVFPSFQYEQLLGRIPWEPAHVPRWELLEDFDGRLDMFAITTYPSFVFSVARKLPGPYYAQIREHTTREVAFVSVGYASAPGREGLNSSTPAEQRRFLERLLRDADALGATLVVWFAARDPAYAAEPPLDLLASIGLRDSEGEPKEAWPAWEEAVRRPYDRELALMPPVP